MHFCGLRSIRLPGQDRVVALAVVNIIVYEVSDASQAQKTHRCPPSAALGWQRVPYIILYIYTRWSGFKFALALSYSASNIPTSHPAFTARAAKGHPLGHRDGQLGDGCDKPVHVAILHLILGFFACLFFSPNLPG